MKYDNLERVLNDISVEALEEYKKQLGDSRIADSMTITVDDLTGSGGKYDVTLHLEHYWLFIENGRKEGSKPPPYKPILDWTRRKNIQFEKVNLKTNKTTLLTNEQTAFIIRNGIAKNGIDAKHTLQKSMENLNNIEDRIADALAQDVEIELSNSINKII